MSAGTDNETRSPESITKYKPLRIWIPILFLLAMALARFVPGLIEDGPANIWMASAFGPVLAGFAIMLWWVALSRAHWSERLCGALGLVLIIAAVSALLHPSVQGPLVVVMTIPMATAGFGVGVILFSHSASFRRTIVGLSLGLLCACYSLLFQNYGTRGDFAFELDWRWNATPEEVFLAERASRNEADASASEITAESITAPQWPGFRGPKRDGSQFGTHVAADWSTPPSEVWRIKVGPAWSSFAVAGEYLFTQEQRGEDDTVVCYAADTGQEVWASAVQSRFFEALGGLGPRATPTIADGQIFAMCAEGHVRCLNASDGSEVWSKDVREVAQCEPPMWGFSSSPLVNSGLVVVFAGGDDQLGVIAFDAQTGDVRWTAPSGKQSYSSLQPVEINGQVYLAILTELGVQLFEPESGAVKLEHAWKHNGYRALQAQIVDGNKLIIPTGTGSGTRMIEITENGGQLTSAEVWTSRGMKPDFNDVVVHDGYLYGFDNQIFACISLETGDRQWKGGRYGKGQALLLADEGLIIVAAENGDVALLRATPEQHEELARFEALPGKTWNHPVVVADRLYLRNAVEAVCYQLPTTAAEEPAAQE